MTRELIDAALGELGVDPEPYQRDALVEFGALLEVWGATINLTAHRTHAAITRHLILDALALGVHAPSFRALADIGSGAGLPGIPIAILYPERRVTLIESRERRHHFQKAAIRGLGLANVTARLGRAETLDAQAHDAAVAQAVRAEQAGPLMARWVGDGGRLLYAGSRHLTEPPSVPGFRAQASIRYRVPCGGPERLLAIAVRESD